jgi:quercetin dioxygenase-like cupin family protein
MKFFKKSLLSLIFISIIGATSYAAQSGAKLHIIKNQADGVADSSTTSAPQFVDGGQFGWSMQMLMDAGVDFFIFSVVPGAKFPMHDSPEEWLGYVISGNGELTLGGKDKKVTSTVKFSKGDYIVFKPNTMHGWKGGSDLLLLVVKTTKNK